eukprot:TRINITY_DN633_c0_g1_i1.p2 TRINITY_DN633_c0_g1~~TRINITY_DN633_c0_g1_i1.p2  ORF type:complete len:103 (-),score=9.20 TRINITY_DN633_c0_g1_i1:570-878(-)
MEDEIVPQEDGRSTCNSGPAEMGDHKQQFIVPRTEHIDSLFNGFNFTCKREQRLELVFFNVVATNNEDENGVWDSPHEPANQRINDQLFERIGQCAVDVSKL